jgi:hypothetical protein
MNGYDRKELTLTANVDCNVRIAVDFDLQSGFQVYGTLPVVAGKPTTFLFPDDFAAHWVRFVGDQAATITAQLDYQ